MKFLSFPAIDRVNSIVHGLNAGDRRFSCKIAVFSLKSTSDERKHRRRIISKVSNHLSSLLQQGISTITPIGDLGQQAVQKLLVHLINTLNAIYADYDFSNVTPDVFEATSFEQLKHSIDSDMLVLAEEIVEEDIRNLLWSGLREAINIHNPEETSIFNYLHDQDNPLFTVNRLWAKVCVIYNPTLKRTAIISCSCRSKILHSPALIPINGTFRSILDLDAETLDLSRRQFQSDDDIDDDDDDDDDLFASQTDMETPYDDDDEAAHYIDSDTDDWFGSLSANASTMQMVAAGGSVFDYDGSLDGHNVSMGSGSLRLENVGGSFAGMHQKSSPVFTYHNHVHIIPKSQLKPHASIDFHPRSLQFDASNAQHQPYHPSTSVASAAAGTAVAPSPTHGDHQKQYALPRGFLTSSHSNPAHADLSSFGNQDDPHSDFTFVPVTLDPKDLRYMASSSSGGAYKAGSPFLSPGHPPHPAPEGKRKTSSRYSSGAMSSHGLQSDRNNRDDRDELKPSSTLPTEDGMQSSSSIPVKAVDTAVPTDIDARDDLGSVPGTTTAKGHQGSQTPMRRRRSVATRPRNNSCHSTSSARLDLSHQPDDDYDENQ